MNINSQASGLTSRTLAGLKWTYLSVAVRLLLSFLFVAILARMLAPSHFGLFGMVLIFVGLAEMLGRHAIGPAIVQRLDLTERHVETGFLLILAIGAILTTTLWLLAPQIGRLVDEPVVPFLIRAASLVTIVNSVGIVPEHLLRRALRFKSLAVADMLAESAGYGLTALVLASQGFGVWALVWGTIMRRAVHVAVVLFYNPPSIKLRFSWRQAKELLRYGSGLSLVGLFNFIAQRGSYFVVGRWLGAAPLGHYTQAYRLVSVPFESVSLTLLNVLFPAMSARQQHIDRIRAVYLSGIEMLSLVVVPASVVVFISAPELVAIVLGGQWGAVVPVVQILAFGLPFQICGALNVPPIRALGGVYREAWRQATWSLTVIGGVYVAIPWGLNAVAVWVVLAWVMIQLLMTQLALSLLKLEWSRIFRCYVTSLWVGVWSGVTVWAVSEQLRSLSLSVFVSLSLQFFCWLVSALAAVYFAPRFARLTSSKWIMTSVHFESMGLPGHYLRNGLNTLLRGVR